MVTHCRSQEKEVVNKKNVQMFLCVFAFIISLIALMVIIGMLLGTSFNKNEVILFLCFLTILFFGIKWIISIFKRIRAINWINGNI